MYTFSKSPRFEGHKTHYTDAFYTLPTLRSTRTCGFGYGTRYDFTKTRNTKTEFISIKRDFDKNNLRGLKFSFGINRDAYAKAYCPGYKNVDKSIPGPGKYNFLKTIGSDSKFYSLHDRLPYGSIFNVKNKSPGPGTYKEVIRVNPEGKVPVSKYSNMKVSNFGLSKSKRFSFKGKLITL
jgi:hypothetical protein